MTCGPCLSSSHLDISRDRLSSYYKFKLTRKVLSLLVQKLGNLMSLDISGHMILENCSISKMDEEAGQTRWVPGCSCREDVIYQALTKRPVPCTVLDARHKKQVHEFNIVMRTFSPNTQRQRRLISVNPRPARAT